MKSLKITKQITNREITSVDKYLKDISKYELIDSDEEIRLAKRIRKGDKIATEKLIKTNLRFVVSVAKQYQNMGLEFEDLISEGNIGLIKAAHKFDETKGFKFISYAVWWIRQSILKSIASKSRVVYLPLNKINMVLKVKKTFSELEKKLLREPSNIEIANELNIDIDVVNRCMDYSNKHISMDKPINEEGDSLYSIFENSTTDKPDKMMIEDSIKQNINSVLSSITEREQFVLIKHFGLNGEASMSLGEISELLNLSKERIRQIKQKSLLKIKNTMRGELLKNSL